MTDRTVTVVGTGYVGLPLACMLASKGFKVKGVDRDERRVVSINRGILPLKGDEPDLAPLLQNVVTSGKLTASVSFKPVNQSEAVFVCVNTPLNDNKKPALDMLKEALVGIAGNLKADTLISIESTIPPGTMDKIVLPLLEENSGLTAGRDFYLVHCPERVMPGKLLSNMRSCPRVLGGLNRASIERALEYYSLLVDAEIYTTDMLSAEITKTVENAYRDVQIAFANEVALACEELGADVYEIRKLVNTAPYRDMHIPGSGVGGHCIPKDPWLLVSAVRETAMKLIPTARNINDSMPYHLASLVKTALKEEGIPLKEARIAVMGVGFLRDSGDVRNSPALVVIRELSEADLIAHDPFADERLDIPLTSDLEEALSGADCAVFVTDHSIYHTLDPEWMGKIMRSRIIVDGRNIFDARKFMEGGFKYSGVGKGTSKQRLDS